MASGNSRSAESVQVRAAALLVTSGALVELSAADARHVVSYMRPKRAKAGDVIIREGEAVRMLIHFQSWAISGRIHVEI